MSRMGQMSEVEAASVLAGDLAPEDLVEVASYGTYVEGSNHGLVILAMEHPYWLVPAAHRVRLLVEPEIAAAARHQLRCYERESAGWPPHPVRDDFGAN